MSSYRPKSLDELNNMFDTAISAEQAIKRGTTKIATDTGDESFNEIAAEIEKVVPVATAKTEEIADFSSDVDSFIKSFQAQTATGAQTHYPAVSTRKAPAVIKNTQTQETTSIPVKADEKKNAEENKNEGFSDWMKIMNDSDDDDLEEERHHKKKKSKKSRKQRSVKQEEALEEKIQEATEVNVETEEAKAEDENTSFEGPFDFDYEEDGKDEKEDMLIESKKKSKKEKKQQSENDAPEKAKSSKGRIAARVMLSIFLAISLLATVAVGSLNTVLNINTGKEAVGGYVLFTASCDFDEVSVKADDLVICKSGYALNGERVVYIDRENKLFSFGTKTAVKTNSDGKIVQIIGTQEIEEENVIGSIEKTIHSLGGYISLVFENYVVILSALCVLTILLAFVVVFALRNKNKTKKEKKAKKEEEQENLVAEEQTQEESEDTEGSFEVETDEEDEDGESANLFSDLE